MRVDNVASDICKALVHGVIFDSCPVFMSIRAGAGALTVNMKNPVTGALARFSFYVATAGMWLASFLANGSLANIPANVFWRAVRQAPPRRELYLYSDSDSLCDASKAGAYTRSHSRST
jgi:hypothetical protein